MGQLETESLYETNKRLMKNEKPLDPILLNKKILDIARAMDKEYYLLMCPDLRQYVFFHVSYNATVEQKNKDLSEVLKCRGQIIDIDNKGNDLWEVWVKDAFDEEIYLYQFHDYTNGVVEVGYTS